MNTIEGKSNIGWSLRTMLLTLFSLIAFFAMANFSTLAKAATPFGQIVSTQIFQHEIDNQMVDTNDFDDKPTSKVADNKSLIFPGSGISLDPKSAQGPFYPNDKIKIFLNLKLSSDGSDFTNGQATMTLSNKYFSKVTLADMSVGSVLKDTPKITTDGDNTVITFNFNTMPSGHSAAIPVTLSLTPGHVKNGYQYPIKVNFKGDNADYTPQDFEVQAKTGSLPVYMSDAVATLDAGYWDGDKLNANYDLQAEGADYLRSGVKMADVDPGEYTFTIKLSSQQIGVADPGKWKYDKTKNTLTQTVTVDPASQDNPSLGGFKLTFLKGFVANSSEQMEVSVTGPNTPNTTNVGVAILKKEKPVTSKFRVSNDKRIRFNSSNGDQFLSVNTNVLSPEVPVISTLTPIDMNDPSGTLGASGEIGTNNATNEGLNDPDKLEKGMNYAKLTSIIDSPGNISDRFDNFVYPLNKLEFQGGDGIHPAVKQGLEQNTVYGDGKEIGHVTFNQPLDLKDQSYKNLEIKFKDPVIFDNLSDSRYFRVQLTGHMTAAQIDNFKNSPNVNVITRDYYNYLESDTTTTEPDIEQPSTKYAHDYITLNRRAPHVVQPPELTGSLLTLFGQDSFKSGARYYPQVNAGNDLYIELLVGVDHNEDAHIKPKNSKVVFIVPDGVVPDSQQSPNSNLTNITTKTNYNNSGKTAIFADIKDVDDYVDSVSIPVHKYYLALKPDENSLVLGNYPVESFFVAQNNNYVNGNPLTYGDFIVNPSETNLDKEKNGSYGLYAETNNESNVISKKLSKIYDF
ncbi:hypothetical protein [Lentilactobacillus kisonensis]|uniref:Uncharacterized protein n=1 Tax=Lentilactobacillus kisonensis F0435 TaxID=797516 RepID=H1LCU7_9LACO|nr:hypothetical protein [Lentilactobacillus kisonensis]EHO53783.1 hypothetical protein HMPREF9104_00411 [Lentilactobacillus kisonensis F0435]